MQGEYFIAVREFYANLNIEILFISSLQQTGLIENTIIENTGIIDADQIEQLEKFICFYYELDINLEGIETIIHLVQRICTLQDDVITLRNRLHLYETSE